MLSRERRRGVRRRELLISDGRASANAVVVRRALEVQRDLEVSRSFCCSRHAWLTVTLDGESP